MPTTAALKPLTVSVRVGCQLLGIGPTKLRELIKEGHLLSIAIGRRRLILYRSLELLITSSGHSEKGRAK